MTTNLVPTQQQYPKISFKKCILYNHQRTISQLTFNASKEIISNPTIKRCLDMHYRDQRHKIFTFLITTVFVKIGSQILHMNRSLALSAPRNWKSVLFKYFAIPYILSSYKYLKDIKRTLMEIESVVDEDPLADELWQPLFERKYPDLSQPLYSSLFTKFKLQDVMQKELTKVSSLL